MTYAPWFTPWNLVFTLGLPHGLPLWFGHLFAPWFAPLGFSPLGLPPLVCPLQLHLNCVTHTAQLTLSKWTVQRPTDWEYPHPTDSSTVSRHTVSVSIFTLIIILYTYVISTLPLFSLSEWAFHDAPYLQNNHNTIVRLVIVYTS